MNRNLFISKLFKDEYPILIKKAYRLTGSRELAEDLIQDTFLLAVAHYDELVSHPSPGGWLTLTLYNLVRNERRRAQYHNEVPLEEVENFTKNESSLSINELLPLQLAEEDRKILLWRYEQQLDYRTIAERLGVSEGACRMRVCRAIKICREILRND